MLVVYCNGISRLVTILVSRDHHWDVQLLETIAWEGAADVSTAGERISHVSQPARSRL